jgi:phosphoribosyl 1,2-cyclic phosphodiesterase
LFDRLAGTTFPEATLDTARKARKNSGHMFHVTILGSGSAGNCALIESATARVLLDGGLSAKQMRERLALCGVNPGEIDAILLTHEHSDHAGGVEVWCKQFGTPVYANGLTAEALRRATSDSKSGAKTDWRVFTTGGDFQIKDIAVQTFSVPHDAMDPVGFMLHHGGESLGFLTDLGFATKLACERVREAHTLFIEANHDEKLLQLDTRRPWATKQRIMSRHGHLSNAAAATVLAEMLGANLRRAVLGHLSRDCNSPELAANTVREKIAAAGAAPESVEVFVATQREISPRFSVGRRSVA